MVNRRDCNQPSFWSVAHTLGNIEPDKGSKPIIDMARKLGILVGTDRHLEYVIKLINAANAKGITVEVFLAGKSVLLTQRPEFSLLAGKARLSLCDTSFRSLGLEGDVPGMEFKDFATPARNTELMTRCDKYLVF